MKQEPIPTDKLGTSYYKAFEMQDIDALKTALKDAYSKSDDDVKPLLRPLFYAICNFKDCLRFQAGFADFMYDAKKSNEVLHLEAQGGVIRNCLAIGLSKEFLSTINFHSEKGA
jgi:hypothetical protein